MTTGEKIQRLRKARGMTQEALAAKLSVSRQAVSRWELNEVLPEAENLVQLSRALQTSIDHLLTDDPPPQASDPAAPVETEDRKRSKWKLAALVLFLLFNAVLFAVTRSRLVLGVAAVLLLDGYLLSLLIAFLRRR